MEPMTGELKETVIREQPEGVLLVLAEEYPPDIVTADDLLCGKMTSSTTYSLRP